MITWLKVLPLPARLGIAIAAGLAVYLLGVLQGERSAGERHLEYVAEQARRGIAVAQARTQVVVRTEVKYRDRIQKIYVQGEQIENQVPELVAAADDLQPGVSVGWVRSFNAAWSGEPAGPAAGTDRDAAGIPLAEVAGVEAHNATACRAWRELAIGLREYYNDLKEIKQ
jgi:hypothetical protein